MKTTMKKITYTVIIIVGVLALTGCSDFLTGCGNFLKYYIRQAPDEAMEEYLEEKYDDDVTCLDWYTGDGSFIWFWNQSGSNGKFSSKKYPGVEIGCGAYVKEDGWAYGFYDNYQNVTYLAGVQKIMEDTAAKYFEGEYYVVAYDVGLDHETVEAMPFEEYITRYDVYSACIFVFDMSVQDACSAMKKFVADLEEQGLQSSLYLGRNVGFEKEDFKKLIWDEDFSPWYMGVEWLYKKVLPVEEGKEEPEVFNIMEEELKEAGFDSDILGIETYTYPEEFTLGPNLDMAITELALLYDDFDNSKIDEDIYQTSFIRRFCQNSRASFDYLEKMREKASSYISKDHVRYIQYSLTKEDVDFKDNVTSSVNINQTTSSLGYGQILSYEAVEEGEEVHLVAEFERGSDGTEITTLHELTVVLVRNPYSCFDGYSIKTLSSKDITPVITGDNKEHTFYGCDMEVEEDGVFTFENYGGEDDVQYGRHIKVDLSDNPALADFVRENAGAEFDVTYIFDENMTQPVYQVVPVSITLHAE